MANYYNRYTKFIDEGTNKILPHIKLIDKPSDKEYQFSKGDRLDSISQKYYGTPYFEWIIRQKNASFGVDEYEWDNDIIIKIPYPLRDTIQEYISNIEIYNLRNL
jgi:hypothetical protein